MRIYLPQIVNTTSGSRLLAAKLPAGTKNSFIIQKLRIIALEWLGR